jgi:hypothetical protein
MLERLADLIYRRPRRVLRRLHARISLAEVVGSPPAQPRPLAEPAAAEPEPALTVEEPLLHVPSPKLLRRERRLLERRREEEICDVGGLAVEMVRRDRFGPELLLQRAGDVLRIEQRVHELDALLLASGAAVRGPFRRARHCACGAALPPGSFFCAHCGRPTPDTPPLAACRRCGQPLPAGANFCAFCGLSTENEEHHGDAGGDTTARPWPSRGEPALDRP